MDVSYGGCRVSVAANRVTQAPVVGAPGVLEVEMRRKDVGAQSLPVVVCHSSRQGDMIHIGFSFANRKRRHYQTIADLMYGDAAEIAKFREGRRKPRGIWWGVYTFFKWGVTGPMRGATLAMSQLREKRRAAAPAVAPAFGSLALVEGVAETPPPVSAIAASK